MKRNNVVYPESKADKRQMFANRAILLIRNKGFTEQKEPPFRKFQRGNEVFEIAVANGVVSYIKGDAEPVGWTFSGEQECFKFINDLP